MRAMQSLGAAVALVLGMSSAWGQATPQSAGAARTPPADPAPLVIESIRDDVFMIVGAGYNITVKAGKEGTVLVEAGNAASSDRVLNALQGRIEAPITYIINTHYHLDSTGGNAALAATGRGTGADGTEENPPGIWAHESVLRRVTATQPNGSALLPNQGWPLDNYFSPLQDVYFNDEAIQLYHVPNAHTDGDTIVFFRRSDVIATGGVFSTNRYPAIRSEDGGSVNGVIEALNLILELAVPGKNEEGGTLIVPGSGHLSDEYNVLIYRDALVIIRDRIQDMIERGMTLQQIQQARPTLDFDAAYGSTEGPWTTGMFVAAVHRDLVAAKGENR